MLDVRPRSGVEKHTQHIAQGLSSNFASNTKRI